jgi:hypothetical protein
MRTLRDAFVPTILPRAARLNAVVLDTEFNPPEVPGSLGLDWVCAGMDRATLRAAGQDQSFALQDLPDDARGWKLHLGIARPQVGQAV